MFKTKEEPLSLSNMGCGAAIEKFDKCLQEVLDNIVDPNTKADKTRKVVLTVKFIPNKDRSMSAVEVSAKAELAEDEACAIGCIIGRTGRKGMAREYDDGQQNIFDNDGNVVSIDRATGEVKG